MGYPTDIKNNDPFLLGLGTPKPKNGKNVEQKQPIVLQGSTGDDPFLLGVKKKDEPVSENTGTLGQAGPDTSPSTLQSNSVAETNPKQSSLISQVKGIVDQYPIQTNDKDMLTAFQDDNTNGINKVRSAIVDNLTKKGEQGYIPTPTGGYFPNKEETDKEIARVNQTFNDYIDNINTKHQLVVRQRISDELANDPDAQKLAIETKDKQMISDLGAQKEQMNLGNNSFKQRQLLTSPENEQYRQKLSQVVNSDLPDYIKEDAKRKLNQNYLATENVNYSREKSGLESVLNTLGMEYSDLKTKASKDPSLQADADNTLNQLISFRKQYDSLEDKYPDVRMAMTARFIGDKIAEEGNGYNTIITPFDVRRAADQLKKENPQWYYKYASDVDYLAKHSNMVPLGGFVGGIKSGLYEIGKNIETGFGYDEGNKFNEASRDVTDENNTAIKGTKYTEPNRIIFDKNDKAYKEIPNEDYGTPNWNSTARFLGQSAPNLAEFVLLDKGLGKAAKIVNELGVDGLLSLGTKAADLKGVDITADELTQAKQALSISDKTQNSLGLFGALTLTGHEQNRKIADDLVDDDSSTGEAKKTLLANLLNLSSFGAFKLAGITPSAVIERALQKGIANDALDLMEKNGWKLTEDQSENFFKETVVPKLKAIGATLGKGALGGTKLTGAMVLDANTRGLIGSIANPNKGSIPSLKDDTNLLLNNILLMTFTGLQQLIHAGFTPTYKDGLYDMGLKRDEQVLNINKMVASGELDQDKANVMTSMVNTIGDEVNKVQNLKNDEGLPLTVKQKRDIAVENFRKRAAEKLSETDSNIDAKSITSEADKNIKDITAENKFQDAEKEPVIQIMNGKEPTELSDEQKVVKQAIADGEIKGMNRTIAEMSLETPEKTNEFLKKVADQALNKIAPESGVDPSEISESQYGKSIVDLAKQKFPIKNEEEKQTQETQAEEADVLTPKEGVQETPSLNEDGKPKIRITADQLEAAQPPKPPDENVPVTEGEGKEQPTLTSIKNDIVDRERKERGLPAAIEPAKKEFGKTWDEAEKVIEKNASAGTDLIDELKRKARPLSDVENATLLREQILTQNDYNKTNRAINEAAENDDQAGVIENRLRLAALSDKLQDIYNVGKSAGVENARGLVTRKMLAKEDFSLASMETQKRAVNSGRPLTEDERNHLQGLHDKIKDFEDRLSNLEGENKKLREENAMKAIEKEAKKDKIQKKKEEIKKDIQSGIDELKNKLREQRGKLSANPFPVELIPTIGKIAKDYARLGVNKIEELVTNIYDGLKDEFPDYTPDDIWNAIEAASSKQKLDDYKERLKQSADKVISNIEKVKTGEKSAKPKSESPEIDIQAKRLELQLERVKGEFRRELEKDRLKNRSRLEKSLDTFVKWERAFKLSSPLTLAKLTMAVIYRTAFTPLEEGVGGIWTGALPKSVTDKAYREAGLNVQAEAKAITNQFTTGMKDAYDTLRLKKGGKSDIEIKYGKLGDLPPEAADFLGHLHSALKAPIKRAEFERSFEKRSAAMLKQGIDVTDPLVQTGIATDAYKDANRSIFMQDNAVTNMYQKMLRVMENSKEYPTAGKVGAAFAKLLLPFVKVPTNIVGETATYAGGLPGGLIRLGVAFAKGIENASPQEKDAILRTLKKGTLGTAALLIGYYNASSIGGYYTGKRNPDDVEVGGLRLFGHDIPKWLVHNPLMESFQIGATIRRVADTYLKSNKGDKGNALVKGILEGGLGLVDQVPFVNQTGELSKLGNENERGYFLGEMAKNTLEPSLLQNVAQWTDTGGKRKPETFKEHLEMGIPGLRENVSEKQDYTKQDLKIPSFKYYSDKGMSLPYTSPHQVSIKDETTGTIKKLSDYPKEDIAKYYKTDKENLANELQEINDNGKAYRDKYGNISLSAGKEKEEVNIDDLDEKHLAQILHIAARKASEETKKQIFYNKPNE